MSFLEAQFPICPSLGLQSTPSYLTDVVRMQSGVERRNRYWSRPLVRYQVTVGPRAVDEVQQVLEFFHAVGGRECGFRFKDWADFKSCRVQDTTSATDQPLVLVAGSPAQYQLTKRYTYGARSQDRDIVKPVAGTVQIADGGVLKAAGSDYTLDLTTGRVTLLFTPAGALTWGGEFDTPVRFDSDDLPMTLDQLTIHEVSFTLTEMRL